MALMSFPRPAPDSAGFFCAGLAAMLAVLLVSPAAAQVRASGDYLARIDRDGDGRVSLDEYQAWMGYAFERMDLDRDGVLSPAELPGGRGRPVRLSEHRDALAAAFGRQDGNHDGVLDARELAAPPQ
jgi:hypothetical protein